jgi:hypothetical protein
VAMAAADSNTPGSKQSQAPPAAAAAGGGGSTAPASTAAAEGCPAAAAAAAPRSWSSLWPSAGRDSQEPPSQQHQLGNAAEAPPTTQPAAEGSMLRSGSLSGRLLSWDSPLLQLLLEPASSVPLPEAQGLSVAHAPAAAAAAAVAAAEAATVAAPVPGQTAGVVSTADAAATPQVVLPIIAGMPPPPPQLPQALAVLDAPAAGCNTLPPLPPVSAASGSGDAGASELLSRHQSASVSHMPALNLQLASCSSLENLDMGRLFSFPLASAASLAALRAAAAGDDTMQQAAEAAAAAAAIAAAAAPGSGSRGPAEQASSPVKLSGALRLTPRDYQSLAAAAAAAADGDADAALSGGAAMDISDVLGGRLGSLGGLLSPAGSMGDSPLNRLQSASCTSSPGCAASTGHAGSSRGSARAW